MPKVRYRRGALKCERSHPRIRTVRFAKKSAPGLPATSADGETRRVSDFIPQFAATLADLAALVRRLTQPAGHVIVSADDLVGESAAMHAATFNLLPWWRRVWRKKNYGGRIPQLPIIPLVSQ